MAHVEIYTDGSCKGNGRADGGCGGWAAILRCNGKTKELSGSEPNTTNNRMELLAVISGLEALTKECTVTVHYDSEYMRNGITKWIAGWKRNGWKTKDKQPVKNQDLWQRLDVLVQKYQIEWDWVRGHTGNPGNERADTLAQAAADTLSTL